VPVDAQQQRPLLGVLVQVGGGFGDREGELADAGGGEPQPFGHILDGLAAGGHRAGVLNPEPPHVLRRRGLQRPAQRDHLTTTTLVPLPGLEVSSNSSTTRRAPDRPRPRPTPELQPSVRARSTSAMPGPSSVKPILTPLLPRADVTTSTRARPPPPCTRRCGPARWLPSPPWSGPPGTGRSWRPPPVPAAGRGRHRLR